MKSQWFECKNDAISLRKSGWSMTVIERKLGIPRSTLSGWFKNIELTEEQRTKLMRNKQDGWLKAREHAVIAHRKAKNDRIYKARLDATNTLKKININNDVVELALAMLYLGEGAKSGGTSISSSDPMILRFTLKVLFVNFGVKSEDIRCELHLRMDQDENTSKEYWSNQLGLPLECFRYVVFDKRSLGKTTYEHYKGVCVISCGRIDIQRKLVFLYTQFCEKISLDYAGA